MTLLNKSPMARKAAWAYCRRCLAVMLCCVLVFGLTVRTAPRAKAVAATGLVATGAWASDAVASTIGFESLIAAAGLALNLDQAVQENIFNRGYDLGDALNGAISAGAFSETTVAWMNETVSAFKEKGGVVAGDSFVIPSDVAEEIRGWTLSNLGFADGIVQYDDYVMYGTTGAFVLTKVDWTKRPANGESQGTVTALGSVVPPLLIPSSVDMSQPYTSRVDIMDNFYVQLDWIPTGDGVSSFGGSFNLYLHFYSASVAMRSGAGSMGTTSWEESREWVNDYFARSPLGALTYVASDYRYYVGTYVANSKVFTSPRTGSYNATTTLVPSTVTTTLEQTAATSQPITKALTVTVPAGLPVTDVGGYDIPVFGDITAEELTGEQVGGEAPGKNPAITVGEISQAVSAAIADTKTEAKAIDQAAAVDIAMTEPDSLGAVFTSKFPFSIPWDVVNAIKLLAAPPVTPYFEVDFFSSMEGFNGFHAQGNTAIVVDFTDYALLGQLCRWTSTVFFIYALAMGTKKLIWTA